MTTEIDQITLRRINNQAFMDGHDCLWSCGQCLVYFECTGVNNRKSQYCLLPERVPCALWMHTFNTTPPERFISPLDSNYQFLGDLIA